MTWIKLGIDLVANPASCNSTASLYPFFFEEVLGTIMEQIANPRFDICEVNLQFIWSSYTASIGMAKRHWL